MSELRQPGRNHTEQCTHCALQSNVHVKTWNGSVWSANFTTNTKGRKMYFQKIPLAPPHSVFWGLPRKIKCIPGSIVVVILPFKCDSMWLLCIGEKTILHNSPLKIYFYGFIGSFHCQILENFKIIQDCSSRSALAHVVARLSFCHHWYRCECCHRWLGWY